MSVWIALATGASMGLASIPHCAAMCGPVAAVACSCQPSTVGAATRYQVGRALSYTTLGALAGRGGDAVVHSLSTPWVGQLLSLAAVLAMLIMAWRVWVRAAAPPAKLVRLRTSRVESPPRRRSSGLALAIGLGSALLPCGALGLMLLAAAAGASAAAGAALSFGFVVTTALGTLAAGGFAGWFARAPRPALRRTFALLLVLGAGVLAFRAWPSRGAECPYHSSNRSCSTS